jgi:arginine-tRNA-protein transferase
MCRSLRIPVDTFRTSTSQRRAWKKNVATLGVRVGPPSMSPEKAALFARFHDHGHERKGWPGRDEADLSLFLQNPFPIEEWTYHVDDRLVGVGYVDALPDGLSAIYFYHEPAEHRRSLGTFNVMALVASARQRRLPYVYLGYYVPGCRSLAYKARFRPNEVLGASGWEPQRDS